MDLAAALVQLGTNKEAALSLKEAAIDAGVSSTEGGPRWIRKIDSEVKFLNDALSGAFEPKIEHVSGSNLAHMHAVLDTVISEGSAVDGLERRFPVACPSGATDILVDVVAGSGARWYKMTARNHRALHKVWLGQCKYGQRSIVDTAKTLALAAKANILDFKAPAITMVFAAGVTDCIQAPIAALGITVCGNVVKCTDPECEESSDEEAGVVSVGFAASKSTAAEQGGGAAGSAPVAAATYALPTQQSIGGNNNDEDDCAIPTGLKVASLSLSNGVESTSGRSQGLVSAVPVPQKISLDVSAMLAICSEMCNSELDPLAEKARGAFKHKVLRDMLSQELDSRAMAIITPAIAGKQLVASPLALSTFKDIVSSVAGPKEQKRADDLLKRLEVGAKGVCSPRVAALKLSGKIKAHSREIFGFGDATGMSTLTANTGFVRAAVGQGVHLSVIPLTCGGRALSELAERTVPDQDPASISNGGSSARASDGTHA